MIKIIETLFYIIVIVICYNLSWPSENAYAADSKNSGSIKHFSDFSAGNFNLFREKLQKKESPLRIAYFGDSIIEGDILTCDLRKALQSKIGGKGLGYIPIISPVSMFRDGIRTQNSDNWVYRTFMNRGKTQIFGLDGSVAILPGNKTGWVDIVLTNRSAVTDEIGLFYRLNDGECQVEVIFDNGTNSKYQLEQTDSVNCMILKINSISKFRLKFITTDTLEAFGITMDTEEGIHVDNLALRGHNGLLLKYFNPAIMAKFSALRSYDLIILHYGVNVLSDSVNEYSWYGKALSGTVQEVRKYFPDTPILIVSAPDRAIKKGSIFTSHKGVAQLVQAQKYCANKSATAFFNLYEAMGGENSMIQWVKNKWAAADYIHFSFSGGKRIARMLTDVLLVKQ